MGDPITDISVHNKFYQLTDILYYTRDTRVFIGHVVDVPKNKYALKRPVPIGRTHLVKREANTLQQIMHPNVVRYIDHSEDPKEPYLVMELVDDTLDGIICRGDVTKDHVLNYIIQLPSFLTLFNRLGIAHTNLKPNNIGYSKEGIIKVLDFSDTIPCNFPIEQEVKNNSATILSPEFIDRNQVTPMTDMYCAARVLECLLFGDHIIAQKPILLMQEKYGHLPDSFFAFYEDMTKCNPLERVDFDSIIPRARKVVEDLENVEIFTSDLLADIK